MFVVSDRCGEVYLSTDNGATFSRMGGLAQFNGTGNQSNAIGNGPPPIPPDPITFNVPNKIVYVVDLNTHNIDELDSGTDSSWQVYLNSSQLPPELQGTSGKTPISNISRGSMESGTL